MSWRGQSDDEVEPGIHALSGQLSVDVSAQSIDTDQGPVDCWCYASRGLARHGQAEVALLVLREDNEQPAAQFVHLFRAFDHIMEAGDRVEPGGYSVISLGAGNRQGLCYVAAPAACGVARGSTLVMLLSEAEALLVQATGSTRVLTRMGQASRFYPFPPWSDLARAAVCSGPEESVLEGVPVMHTSGTVVLHGTRLAIRLPRSAAATLCRALPQLPERAPLALLTRFAGDADAHLVWSPGQRAPRAIQRSCGPDTSVEAESGFYMGGAFVLFIAEQPANGGQLFEDGFAMMLTEQAWAALSAALIHGTDLEIDATNDEYALSLGWTRG